MYKICPKWLEINLAVSYSTGSKIKESKMRKLERLNILPSDGLTAAILIEDEKIFGHVTDLSPNGFAITTNQLLKIPTAKFCDLFLSLKNDKKIELKANVIHTTMVGDGTQTRIGISILKDSCLSYKRESFRVLVDEELIPTASSKHPYIFDHVMHFKVCNLSNAGICLETSLFNKFLFKGMTFDINLILPKIGTISCQIKIKNTNLNGDVLKINASYEADEQIHNLISQYLLLSNKENTPQILRNIGFSLVSVETGRFENAKTEDFKEICSLRHKCYGQKKDIVAKMAPSELADRFDEKARHIVYKVDQKIVAATRIVFNNGDLNESEMFGYYKAKIEENCLNKPFIELSRLCIDPSYRKTDIFMKLMLHWIRIGYETKHTYLVGSAEKPMMTIYKKIGFKNIGEPIEYKLHNTILYPLRADIQDLLMMDYCKDLRKFLLKDL